MSEYQYYEWQAIDRPLTAAEQKAVSALSSHIDVTSTRAWVEYSWSDFRHEPVEVLVRYFDAFLYYANWGMQQVAFRFPRGLLDERMLQPYLWEDCAELEPSGDYLILSISDPREDGDHCFEGEANLSALASLREDILSGDLRTLYLGWLLAAATSDIDEELEPPVPPGLSEITAPLAEFVLFFQLDPFLVQAAATASETLNPEPGIDLEAAIAGLARTECNTFLQRLAEGESHLSLKLNRRLRELAGPRTEPKVTRARRTWAELREKAVQLRQEDEERRRTEAEASRIRELQALAPRAAQTWREVDALIQRKQVPYYDQATALLVKLRDLAVYQDNLPAFQAKLRELSTQYANRPALQERLRKAGLS